MKQDTFYFSHDYNARQDPKIKKLIQRHGLCGYGIFWAIVEDLYNNANALPTDYESIAFDLRTNPDVIESVIKDFGLFVIDGEMFGSLSIQKRLDDRAEKSQKARDNANKRWNKDANAMPPHSNRNAIKEKKRKKSKGEESKGNDTKENLGGSSILKTPLEKKFDEFLEFRKQKKSPIVPASLQAFKDKLWKLSNKNEQTAIEILNESIANGWTGIFELKNNNNGKQESGINKNQHLRDKIRTDFENKVNERFSTTPTE